MTVIDLPTLEELNGWMYDEDDDPSTITEADIHDDDDGNVDGGAEYWQEVRDCCGGRNYWCVHYRQYPPAFDYYEE
jgi:hypothetical protein